MEKIENRDICSSCGGYCCKKSGCDYFVNDFENMKIDYLESVLQEGRVSIVASLNFNRLANNKLVVTPTLSMRARNINRGEIDLLSFKTTCASLQENGCYYDLEHRPSGGSALIPKVVGNTIACYSDVDRLEELKKWEPYQKVLERLVKRHTGKNVYDKLREDVENLFYDITMANFDGVSASELKDVLGLVPYLKEIYIDEYRMAKVRANNALVLQKKYNKSKS